METGTTYGLLTVLHKAPSRAGRTYFAVRCTCGTEFDTRASSLRNGASTRCTSCARTNPGEAPIGERLSNLRADDPESDAAVQLRFDVLEDAVDELRRNLRDLALELLPFREAAAKLASQPPQQPQLAQPEAKPTPPVDQIKPVTKISNRANLPVLELGVQRQAIKDLLALPERTPEELQYFNKLLTAMSGDLMALRVPPVDTALVAAVERELNEALYQRSVWQKAQQEAQQT